MYSEELKARFWDKVNKNGPVVREELGECWVWTANTRTGYGMIRDSQKMRSAHRLSWAWANGVEYPERSIVVRHRCDNPPCVRPDHLEGGNYGDNNHDTMKRNRLGHTELTNELVAKARDRARTGESVHDILQEMPDGITAFSLAQAIRGVTFPYAESASVANPNLEKHIYHKLTEQDYRDILSELAKPVPPLGKDLAAKYGVHPSTITYIKNGKIRNARIIAREE